MFSLENSYYLCLNEINKTVNWHLKLGHLKISASALQKIFFVLRSFYLCLSKYEENIHGEVLFKYTSTPSWKFQPQFRAVILQKTR